MIIVYIDLNCFLRIFKFETLIKPINNSHTFYILCSISRKTSVSSSFRRWTLVIEKRVKEKIKSVCCLVKTVYVIQKHQIERFHQLRKFYFHFLKINKWKQTELLTRITLYVMEMNWLRNKLLQDFLTWAGQCLVV